MNDIKKERNSSFELLRIICTVSIVVAHTAYTADLVKFDTLANSLVISVLIEFRRIACILFLFISAHYLQKKKFKFVRIINIYLLTAFWVVSIYFFFYLTNQMDVGLLDVLDSFFIIHKAKLWYISIYIMILIIYPLLYKVIELEKKIIFGGGILWSVVIVFIPTITLHSDAYYASSRYIVFVYLFVLFVVVKNYTKFDITDKYCSLCGVFALVCYLCLSLGWGAAMYYNNQALGDRLNIYLTEFNMLPCILIAFFTFFFFSKLKIKNNSTINMIAKMTPSVYIIAAMDIMRDFLADKIQGIIHINPNMPILYIIIISALEIVLCLIMEMVRMKLVHGSKILFSCLSKKYLQIPK